MTKAETETVLFDATVQRRRGQKVIFIVLIVLFAGLHFASNLKLFSASNISNLIIQSVFPAFVAWGMMFIFATGMVDLSIGANTILSANIGVLFSQYLGWGYAGLIIMTLISVVLLEHLTMQCAVNLQIPAWVSGLGMALIFESALTVGLSFLPFLKGTNILRLEDHRGLGSLPAMTIIWVIGFLAAILIFDRTSVSFNLRSVGTNPLVAAAMGINRKKTIFFGAVIGAIFIAAGTIVNVSYTGKFFPAAGLSSLSYIFKPLAIVLLSGSFAKYISQPIGILLGSILVTSIFNVLTLLGVPSGTWQEILLGIIVVACGLASSVKYKGVVK